MSALRRGLKAHVDLAVGDLTRRQIMAAVDKIAKTGKRGAAKDLRKHAHTFLEWCVGEGYVEHNVLDRLSRAQGNPGAAARSSHQRAGAHRWRDHQRLGGGRQARSVWAVDTHVLA
nr:hypothetical protein [Bradyrhizobium sp. CCBAU 65884]